MTVMSWKLLYHVYDLFYYCTINIEMLLTQQVFMDHLVHICDMPANVEL